MFFRIPSIYIEILKDSWKDLKTFGSYRVKTEEEIFLDEHNYFHRLTDKKPSKSKGNIHEFVNPDLLPNFDVKYDIYQFENTIIHRSLRGRWKWWNLG